LSSRKPNGASFETPPPVVQNALATETLRNADPNGQPAVPPSRGEERLSLFWRVFGGTLLSIAALVVMTVYQQFNSTLNDVRKEMSRLNEVNSDLVKKEEFNARTTSIWAGIKECGNDVPSLKTRTQLLENQVRTLEQDRKDLAREVQTLRERLATLEARQAATAAKATPSTKEGGH
jgi:septal ring factor EnvC (AmiA/AmiB activator)